MNYEIRDFLLVYGRFETTFPVYEQMFLEPGTCGLVITNMKQWTDHSCDDATVDTICSPAITQQHLWKMGREILIRII
jgi:hypothetical protein